MIYRYKTPFELKPGVWVFPPTGEGKSQGKDIVERVMKKWTPPDHFYHFREGGHVKAIRDHLQSDLFAVADIKSFFQSTTRSMVVKALVKAGFRFDEALDISSSSTVKHAAFGSRRFVPYGFVQSALLATLCLEHSRLGAVVRGAADTGLQVSVYMDDIILSGSENDAALLTKSFEEIETITVAPPYQLNLQKTQPLSCSVQVFNTELSHGHVEVIGERMDKFKVALDEYESDYAIQAVIRYVDGLNTTQAQELEDYASNNIHDNSI